MIRTTLEYLGLTSITNTQIDKSDLHLHFSKTQLFFIIFLAMVFWLALIRRQKIVGVSNGAGLVMVFNQYFSLFFCCSLMEGIDNWVGRFLVGGCCWEFGRWWRLQFGQKIHQKKLFSPLFRSTLFSLSVSPLSYCLHSLFSQFSPFIFRLSQSLSIFSFVLSLSLLFYLLLFYYFFDSHYVSLFYENVCKLYCVYVLNEKWSTYEYCCGWVNVCVNYVVCESVIVCV